MKTLLSILAITTLALTACAPAPINEPETTPKTQEAPVETEEEPTAWTQYTSDKYGISFSYPVNFLAEEEVLFEYNNGQEWFRMTLTDPTSAENTRLVFEVDLDGYGPLFADTKYELVETSEGKIAITEETQWLEACGENCDDQQVWILTNALETKNGHFYMWQFFDKEGGEDLEPLFKEILDTVQFL
jgi:hypothetical protein